MQNGRHLTCEPLMGGKVGVEVIFKITYGVAVTIVARAVERNCMPYCLSLIFNFSSRVV